MEGKSHMEDSYDIDAEVSELLANLKKGLQEEFNPKKKIILEDTEFVRLMAGLGEIEKPMTLADRLIAESMVDKIEVTDLKDFLTKENVL